MISKDNWRKYIDRLAAIDKRAADQMQEWIETHGLTDTDALIEYAYGLVTKYGEASATLSCDMYDYMADLMDAGVPEAIPAETATINEVARGVTWGKYHSPSQIPSVVSRQVRQAGADTMIQNAKRDNAEWAWVPQGDTCAFCITLASRGWQSASKTVLRGRHAEHIHQNCDCTFAIAFKEKDKRQYDYIYDPDKYLDMYYDAMEEEGGSWSDAVNHIRRNQYKQNREFIRTQQNDADHVGQLTKERISDNITIQRYVYTGGHRNEDPLTDEQYFAAEEAARKQGYIGDFGHSETQHTGVAGFSNEDGTRDKKSCLLVIGTDAYPSKDGKTANEKLTLNCCMAHEVVGHNDAWVKYWDQSDEVLEEVQASLRASLFGVGLSDYERDLLYQDAMDRLSNNNINYEDIKDQLHIKER